MVAAKIASMGEGGNPATRSIDLVAQDTAAKLLNVSVPSVKRAKKVQASGDAELIADVESGKVTVSAAAQHVAASITPMRAWRMGVVKFPEVQPFLQEKFSRRCYARSTPPALYMAEEASL